MGGTALLLLGVVIEVGYLHHERTEAAKPAAAVDTDAVDPDDNVFLKHERPSTPDAERSRAQTGAARAGNR